MTNLGMKQKFKEGDIVMSNCKTFNLYKKEEQRGVCVGIICFEHKDRAIYYIKPIKLIGNDTELCDQMLGTFRVRCYATFSNIDLSITLLGNSKNWHTNEKERI